MKEAVKKGIAIHKFLCTICFAHKEHKRDRIWNQWESVIKQLESAFSRKKTFYWFILVLLGFTIKFDTLGGVISLARGVGLLPEYWGKSGYVCKWSTSFLKWPTTLAMYGF